MRKNAPVPRAKHSHSSGYDAHPQRRAGGVVACKAGTDKSKILQAIIWMADMGDFAEMNKEWEAWIPEGQTPARATGEAALATPDYLVEVIITAAL